MGGTNDSSEPNTYEDAAGQSVEFLLGCRHARQFDSRRGMSS